MSSVTLLALSVFISTTSLSSAWSYDDDTWCSAEHWQCCGQYDTQSPIDIDTISGLNTNCPESSGLDWVLGDATSFTMENTGHSLKVTPEGDNPGTLTIDGKSYCLEQFHVHWGELDTIGSEHTINGIAASEEVHFVHYQCSYGSVANAVDAAATLTGSDKYTLAVVAVLYIDDTDFEHFESSLLNKVISHAPEIATTDAEYSFSHSADMTTLVRDTISDDPVYFYYKGSLTTPGCNPSVHWNVLRDPMYVSSSMLSILRSSLRGESNEVISKNCRATQNNANKVYLCGAHQESHSGDDSDDDDIHHEHFESSDSS